MKRIFILTIFYLLFLNEVFATNYDQFVYDRKVCYSSFSSNCFYKLLSKYSSDKNYANIIRFEYGTALMAEKEYVKARNVFQGIITSEKENTKLAQMSKANVDKINAHMRKIYQANSNDKGNYYSSITVIKWKNNKDIKVCIKGNTGKEYLFKNAFRMWAQKSGYAINISFVSDIKSADIICFFTDFISDDKAGLTEYKHIVMPDGKKYFTSKVYVKVSLTNSKGGKYTDNNLESIALHEAGHALGISGHSENINDIMYYSTEMYQNGTLSKRDINTLKVIYSN